MRRVTPFEAPILVAIGLIFGGIAGWRAAVVQPQGTIVKRFPEVETHEQRESMIQALVSTSPPAKSNAVPVSLYPIDILSVHDADTYKIRIYYPWGISLTESVRCLGFDAYEVTRTRRTVGEITDEEITKGKKARDEVSKLLTSTGNTVYIQPDPAAGDRDPYGRLLGFIRVQQNDKLINLETWMKDNGYCRN